MSRIYSALNERTNETVGLYHNAAKSQYEVIIRGDRITTIVCHSLNVAYAEYNNALR